MSIESHAAINHSQRNTETEKDSTSEIVNIGEANNNAHPRMWVAPAIAAQTVP